MLNTTQLLEISALKKQIQAIAGDEYAVEVYIQGVHRAEFGSGVEKQMEELVSIACRFTGIRKNQIRRVSRKTEIVRARQLFYYLMRKTHPTVSLAKLGRKMSGQNHATVINAIERVENDMLTDKQLKSLIECTINKYRNIKV